MANLEISDFDEKAREVFPAPFVSLDIAVLSKRTSRQRILHRVPPDVRENKKHIYDPSVVSLGPYHHGQPQFRQGETFKDEVLSIMLDSGLGASDQSLLLRRKILERVDEIRSFYGELSIDEYEDEALVEMMLRDACLILYIMKSQMGNGHEKRIHIVRRLGMSRVALILKDLFVLENQIPLWVIKLLITLTTCDDDDITLIYKFLSYFKCGDHRLSRVLWEEGKQKEPLHILDAYRASLFKEESGAIGPMKMKWRCPIFQLGWRWSKSSKSSSYFEQIDSPFLSVTTLKAKGIHVSPGSTRLNDIRFKSYLFYGKLQLPICFVSETTMAYLSNLIAFELSSESDPDFAVMSYVGFMKSLIQNSEDVKELRGKGILFSSLANDEEVVKIFKEVDCFPFFNIFQDVKMRIDEHCSSKAKTWMAELIHTYFRTPWSSIALFAAIILLWLTFLQTYYTMNPRTICNN